MPPGCDDLDAAYWWAIRSQTGGELPRQDLETWGIEQKARGTRDVAKPGRVDAYDASSEAIAEALVCWAHELPLDARARLLAGLRPLFDRLEALRPGVWREYLRGILDVVAHAAPEDPARTAAWAVDELRRVRDLCRPGEYEDTLARIYHAARSAELLGMAR